MRRDVFQAIADPTRIKIINILVRQTLSINNIAAQFKISRPAISKQIKILQQCGVIKIRQQGKERHCIANLAKLKAIHDWLEQYKLYWIDKIPDSN